MSAKRRVDDFSDLDDTSLVPTGKSYNDLTPVGPVSPVGMGPLTRSKATLPRFQCDRCHQGKITIGYRNLRLVDCRKCKGTGLLRTDPRVLAANRTARAANKVKKALEWRDANKDVMQWVEARRSRGGFAGSLFAAYTQYGSLTDGQLAAVHKILAQDAEQAHRAPFSDVQFNAAGFEKLLTVFRTARASGLKWPKLRVQGLVFSVAPAAGKNAGCLYVKTDGDTYLGKVSPEGKFYKSGDCAPAHVATIEQVAADPLAQALLHGLQTGHCSCCGLELTNPESVRLGIGPICRSKWGM